MRSIPTGRLAPFAICAALLLGGPAGAQDDDDLDLLNSQQLAAALNAELDDVYESLDPNSDYDLDDIFEAIMYALSDAGDDYSEQAIDLDDLIEEMEETGVSLEDVVWNALQSADRVSDSGRGGVILVQRQGGAYPSVAVRFTSGAIMQRVPRVRRF